MIVAQGKRGTTAALGNAQKINLSLFSFLPRRRQAGAEEKKNGRLGLGADLPGAAASAASAPGWYALALSGQQSERLDARYDKDCRPR
jgi:hypothetical protein